MITTRGRYALRVMLDLAQNRSDKYIPMKDVAARQEISLKYIERIVPALTKAGLLEGVHGKGGGYRLTRTPDSYTVGEILRATEGDLAPVSCLASGAAPCARAAECKTLGMWKKYNDITNEYFDGITLQDLLGTETPDDYVI
jgi:Rrf2 family transcriptional regulator, iron-sulfur cluster assembly transcription factor